MAEVIVDADVEELLIDWAGPALASRGVTRTDGSPLVVTDQLTNASECVAIYRVGGVRRNLVVDVPTVTFEAKAATKLRASRIARELRALVNALPGSELGGCAVNRVDEFSGPANLPVDSAPCRYVFTVAIDVASLPA